MGKVAIVLAWFVILTNVRGAVLKPDGPYKTKEQCLASLDVALRMTPKTLKSGVCVEKK